MENKNGDIIVFDMKKKVIVVVDKNGWYWFNYIGWYNELNFNFGGICIDKFGNILVCNIYFIDYSIYFVD